MLKYFASRDNGNMEGVTVMEVLLLGKKITRMIGKAIGDFGMICGGDRIAVGMSGGKDSSILAVALARLRDCAPEKFDIVAVTVDPTGGQLDMSEQRDLCAAVGIELEVVAHPIFGIIEERRAPSPCSFCANMRRGILAGTAVRLGCRSIALGHHLDDAAETALLNILYAGRWDCFAPNMYMDRTGVRVIRPMVYVPETLVASEAARLGIVPLDMGCPYGASSKRAEMKSLLASFADMNKDIRGNILNAIMSSGIWAKKI